MRNAPVITVLALVLMVFIASACSDKSVPPPGELAPISDELRARVRSHEESLARDGFAKARTAIDRTLDDIEREYGKKSVAVPQSLTEAGLMVMHEGGGYAEALPYMAHALDASVAVYGPEHRETAFAVHDYAYAMFLGSPGKYVPAATPLFERALAIRRRVLGADAPETAGSERSLANQLVLKCRSQPKCAPDDALLTQAAQLAEHSLDVFRASLGDSHVETRHTEREVDDIARARGKTVVARTAKAQANDAETPSGGCGRSTSVEPTDLSWVRSAAKLYRLGSDGKFSVGGFDGRPWKELAHHQAASLVGEPLFQSDDRRWIAYDAGESELTRALWLFDTHKQAERRVAVTQRYFTSDPEFSPNGLTLAYFTSYDDRWTGKQGMGLYLVDTQSGRNTFAGFPADSKIGPLEGSGSIQWAADGSAVLIHLVGHPDEVFTREFYRFDMKLGVFRRIEGDYDKTIRNGEVFIDGGKQIATHAPGLRSTRAWYGELASTSGSRRAYVDDKHRLLVRHANAPELLVVAGRYDDCEGVTVGITGWVDDDQYLVYRNENRQFIFDPVTRRQALLLEDSASAHVW